MPEFANPFSGLAADRKVTHEELIRAIRYMIAAEYEAVQLYMQLAESTDHLLAQEVLKDIADEERVHAGEFMRLLKELAPDEATFYAEGEEEVQEIIDRLAGAGNPGVESSEREGLQAGEVSGPPASGAQAGEKSDEEESDDEPPPSGVGDLYGK